MKGHLTGFHGKCAATDFGLENMMVGILLTSNHGNKPPS